MENSIYGHLAKRAAEAAEQLFLLAPGRAGLTYRGLHDQVLAVSKALWARGVGAQDTVALVLPNGPEMASALLAVASCAIAAPLNPAYKAEELEFYLADLRARALVVLEGEISAARVVAERQGIQVIEISVNSESPAGVFEFTGPDQGGAHADFNGPRDPCLVIHTSGTTGRPKRLRLSQSQLRAGGETIRVALELTGADCALNVMPLFHTHALTVVMAAFLGGGSVVAAAGFDPPSFFQMLNDFKASWYSASPLVHQSIVAFAESTGIAKRRTTLRVIRSGSSHLPPRLMADLERVFRVPVIEFWGMTEACGGSASNRLSQGGRKRGSVGRAIGTELAIIDSSGNRLPPMERGELIVRGPNVITQYLDNPEADRMCFWNGWLRSGDQGYLDKDGFCVLTGRLKDIINRGSEKIAPIEIDSILLTHPAIETAVTVGIPDALLGEQVAAVVVLRNGATATPQEITDYCALHMADFKVPRQILIVPEVPKSATGKVNRRALAESLPFRVSANRPVFSKRDYTAPRSAVELWLTEMWQQMLGVRKIGIRDNFFALGGYSLLGLRVLVEVNKEFQKRMPLSALYEAPTIEEFAVILGQNEWSTNRYSLVPTQPFGTQPPFFGIHWLCFNGVSRELGLEQPMYGLRYGLAIANSAEAVRLPSSLEALAAHYVEEMRQVQKTGPYHLIGYSLGGVIAYEMAQQLVAGGEQVGLLAMFDSFPKRQTSRVSIAQGLHNFLALGPSKIIHQKIRNTWEQTKSRLSGSQYTPISTAGIEAELRLTAQYEAKPYPGKAVLVKARNNALSVFNVREAPEIGWGKLVQGRLEVHEVPGVHDDVLAKKNLPRIAQVLRSHLPILLCMIFSYLLFSQMPLWGAFPTVAVRTALPANTAFYKRARRRKVIFRALHAQRIQHSVDRGDFVPRLPISRKHQTEKPALAGIREGCLDLECVVSQRQRRVYPTIDTEVGAFLEDPAGDASRPGQRDRAIA